MKLVTVATHSERYFPVLLQSCKRYDIEPVVLGWGQKWLGFTWKLNLVTEYLKSIDRNEIVIFIDAYDVILLRNPHDIEKRFDTISKHTDTKLIVGWEKAKSPMIEALSHAVFGTCKTKRINSGTYIGRAGDIFDVLTETCKAFDCVSKKSDDQIIFGKFCKIHPEKIHVDVDEDLFIVINAALYHKDITDDVLAKFAHKTPYFIHGIGATNMDMIIKKLGYNNPYPITFKDTIKYDIKSITHFIQYLWIYIVLLISICIIILVIITLLKLG